MPLLGVSIPFVWPIDSMNETNQTRISMAWRGTAVFPVRQQWRCPSLALSHRYVQSSTIICIVHRWAAIVDLDVEMTTSGIAGDDRDVGLAVLSCMCYGYSTHVILRTSHCHWERGSSIWRLCRSWWHRGLSLQQHTVSPATAGLSFYLFPVLHTLPLTYLISNRLYFEIDRVNETDHRFMNRVLQNVNRVKTCVSAYPWICWNMYVCVKHMYTWSETYFRQDLFPSCLFSRRQFHAIVNFRLKSISDLDSGSLPRFFGEFIYMKIKIVVS